MFRTTVLLQQDTRLPSDEHRLCLEIDEDTVATTELETVSATLSRGSSLRWTTEGAASHISRDRLATAS